ncbi:GTP-binding protein [Croceivirga thetidis]|uniref:GTP-binding protein n=1 Tax=Croceivirga thetidis TaxID=2721623 RepID=A0ABX1GPD2_9FLAO|nr:GTP-binding protein [Croceivirga thetidis]NKI31764.1 GTP-binding protein [Croceivirga thetidis]
MSELVYEIILRPRFEIKLFADFELLKKEFDITAKNPFLIKRVDEHVYIRFQKGQTNFWSPQLHLEISSFSEGKSSIHGVFGPNPTLWTFFMFLHFGVATLFLILGVFAYSKYTLGHNVNLLIIGMLLLVFLWLCFYAFGRLGKAKGKSQMEALRQYADELFIAIQKKYTD